jgi:uncharacterized surface anchored protein
MKPPAKSSRRSVVSGVLLAGLMFLGSCATVRVTFLGYFGKEFVSRAGTGSVTGVIVAEDGLTPVAGAKVSALEHWWDRAPYRWTATTTAEGTFRLDYLPPGYCEIRAEAPGLVEQTTSRVLVAADQTASGIKLVLIPGGSISGRVTEKDGTTPMGGKWVTASGIPSHRPGLARTSEDGTYRIGYLSPGEYTVAVNIPQYAVTSRTQVTVAAGQETRDVNLSLVRAGMISGTATENDGVTPIPGVLIRVQEPNGATSSALSAQDGTYQLRGLVPGEYEVTAEAAGHTRTSKVGVDVIPGKETGNVDFALANGAGIAGRVVRAGGSPKKGATVVASTEGERAGQAVTREDGSYLLDALAAGTYKVEVLGADDTIAGIVLAEGKTVTGIDFTLPTAATLSGRVTAETSGLPLEGVTVAASRHTPVDGLPILAGLARTDSSGEYTIENLKAGVYAVAARGPGFETQKKESLSVASNQDVVGLNFSLGSTTEAGSIAGVAMDSATGMPLENARVRLFDAPGDPALLGASALTDSSGNYILEWLPPGRYGVYATKAGHAVDCQANVMVAAGGTTHVDFLITEGGSVSGTATSPSGRRVAGAMVFVTEKCPGSDVRIVAAFGQSNANGEYLVEHVKPGLCAVVCLKAGYLRGQVSRVRVADGQLTSGVDCKLWTEE